MFSPEGAVINKQEFSFNSENILVESKNFSSTSIITGIYKSDDKGRALKNESYDTEGNLARQTKFEYDEHGSRISEVNLMADGSERSRNDFRYEYDDQGNWVSQTTMENGAAQFIIGREIEYY